MGRRGIKKQFWFSKEHVARLADLSKRTKLPEVTIMRMLLDFYTPREAPGEEFHTDMNNILEKYQALDDTLRRYPSQEVKTLVREEIEELRKMRSELLSKYLLPEKI